MGETIVPTHRADLAHPALTINLNDEIIGCLSQRLTNLTCSGAMPG